MVRANKKLALSQEEQMAKLTHLESRIAAPFSALVPPPRVGGKVPPPPDLQPRLHLSHATSVGSKDILPGFAEQCSQIPVRHGLTNLSR